MKRKTFVFLLFMTLLLNTGCMNQLKGHPKAELKLAETAFQGTVRILSALNREGHIGEDEQITIGEMIYSADNLLDLWSEKLLTTGKRPAVADHALYAMRELARWQMLAEKRKEEKLLKEKGGD